MVHSDGSPVSILDGLLDGLWSLLNIVWAE